ncbi:hypothetical protein FRC98_18030 [Lujinxingia vulgaris]|uniref:DUF4142 domain-containing protein n=1 Tax=Lujinxingia vulgaris TaxID=2600176 RepID=A0A5C6X9N6_9DELT|nr:hypothetical protein [Lujinxingia vulgaris]TXD34732.1 hypothetical protein FRC98_18030 [Lujinxingia vulgaris]
MASWRVTRAWKVALCAAALTMLVASPGFAQSEPTNGTPFYNDIFSLSTSTTTTAVVVGAVILTVTLVNDTSAALDVYLDDNAALVQQDLHLGGGEATADLAAIFGVPAAEHEAFAQLLFETRQALSPLCAPATDDAASRERARTFAAHVFGAMAEHAALSAHLPQHDA